MDKLYFLIDTNIFIQLEDHAIISESFNSFHRLCNENPAVIYIHPLSKIEIEKDKNIQRRKTILSKIDKYTLIEDPPLADEQEIKNLFGIINNSHDKIDCQLLYTLKKHTIHFLVTEDNGIHQRAKKLSLKNSTLTINQANDTLRRLFPQNIDVSFPKIENTYLYRMNNKDKIFDSLKQDYPDFSNWFQENSQDQTKAWTVQNSNSNELEAVCIYKESKQTDCTKYNLPRKSLKLATFKVAESYRGKKLGELMLKQAFLYSVKNNFQACWMTIFSKHQILIDFIKDFGFNEIGTTGIKDIETNKEELVFLKTFTKPDQCQLKGLEYYIQYSPFYDDKNDIGKYIIPIQQKYYHILFPEQKQQISFPLGENETPGNTIKKVYLCHSSTRQLNSNDLLFFYVSSPIQKMTSLGIIESVFRSKKLSEIVSYIGKRSVYSFSEIKNMTKKKEILVIEFRFIKHFEQDNLSLQMLKREKIIYGPPQSIQKINNYERLKLALNLNKKGTK